MYHNAFNFEGENVVIYFKNRSSLRGMLIRMQGDEVRILFKGEVKKPRGESKESSEEVDIPLSMISKIELSNY